MLNVHSDCTTSLLFYLTSIHPVSEYACSVFHATLPQYLSNDMEVMQRCALWVVYLGLSYFISLEAASIHSLNVRREVLSKALFDQNNCRGYCKCHMLHPLLLPINEIAYYIQNQRFFTLPKTNSFKNTFIMDHSSEY